MTGPAMRCMIPIAGKYSAQIEVKMQMIDYDEELKKFEPCLDVTEAESAIYDRELTDILDILKDLSRDVRQSNGRRRRSE